MKTLAILLVAFGLAVAKQTYEKDTIQIEDTGRSLVDEAAPLLESLEQIPSFLKKTRGELPLRVVLGKPEARELDVLEDVFRKLLGEGIRKFFERLLEKIQDLGHNAQDEYLKLFELLEHPTLENAEKLLQGLELLEEEKKELLKLLNGLFGDQTLTEVMLYSGEGRFIDLGDTLDRIISWFSGLGSWISDSLDVFKAWAKDIFIKTMDTAKPITDQIQILATDFLQNNWDKLSVTLVKQALSFFHPFAGQLGGKLVEKFIELAKEKGLIPWQDVTVSSLRYLK